MAMEKTLFDLDEYEKNVSLLKNSFKAKEYIDTQDALGYLVLSQLTRVADALEDISGTLGNIEDSLEALAECIVYIPPTPQQVAGFHFIRIGGDVFTE